MWQEIAICIIGAVALGYMVYKVYRMITIPKHQNACGSCCGCSLKKEWECEQKK